MDDDLAGYLKEVERALGRMRAEIRSQQIFIDLLLKAASASIEQNRESILTALWIAYTERAETYGEDDEIAGFLARYSAHLDAALVRAPPTPKRRGSA